MFNIKAIVRSAVLSVRTPGVLPTGIPRWVHALISILSTPTAILLITLSIGACLRIISVTGMVSSVSKPSALGSNVVRDGSNSVASSGPQNNVHWESRIDIHSAGRVCVMSTIGRVCPGILLFRPLTVRKLWECYIRLDYTLSTWYKKMYGMMYRKYINAG